MTPSDQTDRRRRLGLTNYQKSVAYFNETIKKIGNSAVFSLLTTKNLTSPLL
jgi:hypothetical protein